jgi:acyl-CoA thioester hydrolase
MRPRESPLDLGLLAVPHPAPFLCDLRIGPGAAGEVIEHVSNIEYVRWLDRGAELHADSLGYTRRHMLDEGVMWFVARHEIDYVAEAWLGDELVLATWVRDMHRVKSWRDTVVVRPSDAAIVCRAATLWVLIGLATRRPTRIPAEMAARFAPLRPPGAGTRPAAATRRGALNHPKM